jgi:peptide/nickel transport system permease protein
VIELIAKRLARGLWVTWIAYTAVFFLAFGAGDPAVGQLGARAQPDQIRAWREQRGLDRPLPEVYVHYLGSLARGDMQDTFASGRPVAQVLGERLPRTMLLGAMALVLEILLGVSIGTIAALRRNKPIDALVMALAFLGISAPTFLTGLLFLYVLAFRLGIFPVGGYGVDALDHVRHALLPAFTIAIVGAATYARIMRGEMIEMLRQDYVRTARAKGLSSAAVVRHAFRNALLPIVTLIGVSLPLLVSGAIVSETIYAWPGIGRLAVESIHTRDVPTILGIVLLACVAVQVGNLGADLAVAALDPRVRLGGGSK